MKRFLSLLSAVVLLFSLSACGGSRLLTKSIPLEPPNRETPDCAPLTAFGLGLLRRAEGENPVVSPLSAYVALAMAAEGAAGQTRGELDALLGPDARDVSGYLLSRLGAETESTFTCADSAWVRQGADILPSYLDTLARCYVAEMFSSDLNIRDMNRWVSDKTHKLIPALFDVPLDDAARLVLINTLYMKAKWAVPFDGMNTSSGVFHGTGGDTEADFMRRTGYMELITGEDYEGVLLPYRGGQTRFAAVKPTRGTARALLEKPDGISFEPEETPVALSLPRFALTYGGELNDVLRDMGCTAAFDPDAADFSGMCDTERLYISFVLQKVHVIVDEEGTEAAAATAVGMATGSGSPRDPYRLVFDEPFLWFVLDAQTGAPLFAGILDSPAA